MSRLVVALAFLAACGEEPAPAPRAPEAVPSEDRYFWHFHRVSRARAVEAHVRVRLDEGGGLTLFRDGAWAAATLEDLSGRLRQVRELDFHRLGARSFDTDEWGLARALKRWVEVAAHPSVAWRRLANVQIVLMEEKFYKLQVRCAGRTYHWFLPWDSSADGPGPRHARIEVRAADADPAAVRASLAETAGPRVAYPVFPPDLPTGRALEYVSVFLEAGINRLDLIPVIPSPADRSSR